MEWKVEHAAVSKATRSMQSVMDVKVWQCMHAISHSSVVWRIVAHSVWVQCSKSLEESNVTGDEVLIHEGAGE